MAIGWMSIAEGSPVLPPRQGRQNTELKTLGDIWRPKPGKKEPDIEIDNPDSGIGK